MIWLSSKGHFFNHPGWAKLGAMGFRGHLVKVHVALFVALFKAALLGLLWGTFSVFAESCLSTTCTTGADCPVSHKFCNDFFSPSQCCDCCEIDIGSCPTDCDVTNGTECRNASGTSCVLTVPEIPSNSQHGFFLVLGVGIAAAILASLAAFRRWKTKS